MTKFKKIMITISAILIIGGIMIGSEFNKKDFKNETKKTTFFKSNQKTLEHHQTNSISVKAPLSARIINHVTARGDSVLYLPKRSVAQRISRKNPVSKYLTTTLEGYDFTDSILAIRKRDYKGNQQDIIGEIQGMLVIKTNTPSSGSLPLIKKENEDRVGLYMGKIVLIHKQDDNLENEIAAIVGVPGMISHVSGVYIIESPKVADSIQLLTNLKEKFKNTQIDLDINYSRNEAK